MNKLKPYQIDGVEWLLNHRYGLLADDMGLGKTVQVITAIDKLKSEKILIVCPAAARVNWNREFTYWSKSIPPTPITKTKDKPQERMVCSYEYAASNVKKLTKLKWDVVVFDESHFLKTPNTKRAKACYGTKGLVRHTKRVWCLSGTPAPNNPSELWTLFYTFGITKSSYNDFIMKFCITFQSTYGIRIMGTIKDKIPLLKKMLEPIMLRRKKEDVLMDLPPIEFGHLIVEAGEIDITQYASFIQYVFPKDRTSELADKIIYESRILEHYFQENKMGNKSLKTLMGLAPSVATLRRYIGLQKVDAVAKLVHSELKNKAYDKIVIFAIHRDVIVALYEALREFKPVTLYGRTKPESRQESIDKFQNRKDCRVFLGNIIAAGTAITLTAAHHVLFVEQDWVPGNNAQAAMRCHRIGQKNKVSVRVVGLADSFDERLARLLKLKTQDLVEIFDK